MPLARAIAPGVISSAFGKLLSDQGISKHWMLIQAVNAVGFGRQDLQLLFHHQPPRAQLSSNCFSSCDWAQDPHAGCLGAGRSFAPFLLQHLVLAAELYQFGRSPVPLGMVSQDANEVCDSRRVSSSCVAASSIRLATAATS
jgi:hypothetical protein